MAFINPADSITDFSLLDGFVKKSIAVVPKNAVTKNISVVPVIYRYARNHKKAIALLFMKASYLN